MNMTEQMKNLGITSKTDNMGRLIIPIESRRFYMMEAGDPAELTLADDGVYIRRFTEGSATAGIVRLIDKNGRVTIPAKFRKKLGISVDDEYEYFSTDTGIFVRKYVPVRKCFKCGATDDLLDVDGITVCHDCGEQLRAALSAKK